MTSAGSSTPLHRLYGDVANAAQPAGLASLAYRSRALSPLSEMALYRLLRTAQARNRAEGLTGLLVYDKGYFFQWLEGPAASLERVWASIRADRRHGALELLGQQASPLRFFADWDLKLYKRRECSAGRAAAPPGTFDIPPELLHGLRRHPGMDASLLERLAMAPPLASPGRVAERVAERVQSALLGLIEGVVIPQLAARHAGSRNATPAAHPRVGELVRLLIAAHPHAALDLVAQLHARAGAITPLCASLFEPAARSLGDLWQADDCSEFDVSLGLCRLQSSILQLDLGPAGAALQGLPVVLVVSQPGETHTLGAVLDAELLGQAGWDMHREFPATDAALEALVAGTWFDALDLSLSAAFRREHWLPRLAHTIAQARAASRNPALVVVVGGRVFGDAGGSGASVGADASCASAVQVEARILQALRAAH